MTLSRTPGSVRHGAFWIACLALFAAFPACKGKPVVKDGAIVKIHYTLTVDEDVVDSSRQGEPLVFTAGSNQIVPGLEEQLKGLSAGDKRQVVVEPEKAYGPVRAEALQKVPIKNFQGAGKIAVGATVTAENNGRVIQARVTEVSKDMVTIDLNHPMAGKRLNFDVEVVDVQPGEKGEGTAEKTS